ncbi:MAG TPA: DUF4139 domain-containing protein [Streptosporangiaceae bacterium]|nr:DUF4139 domain-containing protein [Streptosporangiaceae bacterium]
MTEGRRAHQSGIEAPITAVTVFRDGARVVRSGSVTAGAGLSKIMIGSLPASADPASVRVAVRGQHVALLDIEVDRRYSAEPRRDEVARLRAQAEARRDEVQALDDADAAGEAAIDFTGHLSEAAAVALARAVSFGRIGHGDLDQMAAHLSDSTASALARRREISARRRIAQRELEAAEQRLAELERRSSPAAFAEVSATVEAAAPAIAEIDVSYHVSDVSWRPLYDLGLSGEVLAISYLAEVTQRTGEDWPAAELAVSTTRRGQHQTLPELRPWYVGVARPEPPVMAMAARVAAPAMLGGRLDTTVPAPQAAPAGAQPVAQPLTAEVGEAGAGLVYRIARPLAVPSDGSPHKTTIARLDLDATLDYLAVPVLAPEAYLRATMTNTSELLLLPGPARVFHDGEFVGETSLKTVAAGEEFELQLGVDDQIRVERKLRRRSTSKAVIGGSRTIDIGYEISVENHRPGEVSISVRDHIPVAADGEIKVRLRETNPNPDERTDLGELSWKVKLDSGGSATIRHRFTVEHPAQVMIRGID